MGLFDFIKNEFIEVIEWIENDATTMLYKFPDKDANIKYGASLTVRESQVALFLNEGQIADVFEPGMHELITDNMPVMTTLKNWDKGFKSPFKSDVYFASTKTFTNVKWGTVNPVIIRDPEFKQVRVKAHGVYFIKISNPEKFFTEFSGTKPLVRLAEVETKMREIVTPKFAEALAEAKVSVLDLVANYTELGEQILPHLQQEFDVFGLELVKFQISSTSLPKEVEKFYDKMTNMNMVDDMNKFQQFQSAEALEKAAENPGGGAGEGIGMGMGFGMANMMMQNQQSGQKTPVPKEEIIAMIKELGELKESGILSEKEFESKKKELLSRI